MANPFKSLDWNVFLVLFVAGLLGVVAVLPYALDVVRDLPIDQTAARDLPMVVIVALALLQNGILLAAVIAAGLVLSDRVGLRIPLINGWAKGDRSLKPKSVLVPGVRMGAAVGVALVGIEAVFFLRHLPSAMLPMFEIALWKRLLGSLLYGGITEELLMRLFLLSLVAWLFGRWWKTAAGMPSPGAFRAAIVVVAVLFGLGHLPATAAIAALTPGLVGRALVLNGVAGAAFGYLYWRHGLEAAMAGHMSAHVVMQIPGVMLLKALL